jgi:hypothetical protein
VEFVYLFRRVLIIAVAALFLLGLAACSAGLPAGEGTPEASATAISASPTATFTPAPTETPETPLALLVVSSGSDPELSGSLQTILTGFADQNGLRVKVLPGLSAADLDTNTRLVIVLPPDPGVANLAAAAPETQFLVIGIPGLNPNENLSIIASDGARPDQLGFLAGYISAVITEDWRVGVISAGDTPAGKASQQSFINGVVYFCGLCRPAHPPFYQYPLYAELPAGASQADQQGAADYMVDHAVETVYVAPGAGDNFLLDYLAKSDIHIIGSQTPPAGVEDHWVASVHTDLLAAVQASLPKLMNGEGGLDLEMPLVISDQNEALFSPGRQNLVKETLDNLQAGYIDTGIDPATGEAR